MDRRAAITALVRKYAGPGEGLAGVLAWAEDAEQRLSELDVSDEALAALTAERDAARAEVDDLAARVSAGRTAAADGFAAEVGRELAGLAMKSAQVSFSIESQPDDPGPEGDRRGGAPAGRRTRARRRGRCTSGASGGELSRVMLAIEVVFAGADPVPVMVFDEVDAGVGGQAAGEIGKRLARLARDHQVVVVTHLAQVAAFADTHLVVDKSPDAGAGVTATDIRAVAGEDRVRELARMLSGLADSDTGQAHARELLAVAAAARA